MIYRLIGERALPPRTVHVRKWLTVVLSTAVCGFSAVGSTSAKPEDPDTVSADSAAYYRARTTFEQQNPEQGRRYINTADELAGLGLYEQAMKILEAHQGEMKSTAADEPAAESSRALEYRIRAGGEYRNYEDPDIQRNKYELIDPHLLDEQRGYMSGGFTWRPAAPWARVVEPTAEVSNREGSCDLRTSALLLDSLLVLEIEGGGEKQFLNEVYENTLTPRGDTIPRIVESEFVGAGPIDSDLLSGSVTATLRRDFARRNLDTRCPIRAGVKNYRVSRSPYVSYAEYHTMPEVSWNSADFSNSLVVNCEAGVSDYFPIRTDAGTKDTADRVLVRPEISYAGYAQGKSVDIRCSYLYENFLDAGLPSDWGIALVHGTGRISLSEKIEPSLSAEYRYEHSARRKALAWWETTVTDSIYDPVLGTSRPVLGTLQRESNSAYTVRGNYLRVTPRAEYTPVDPLAFTVGVMYEESWHEDYEKTTYLAYPEKDTTLWDDYLAESLRMIEPQADLAFERPGRRLAGRCSFRHAESKRPGRYEYDRRDSWRFGAEADGTVLKRLHLLCMVDYEISYQDGSAEALTNTSVSAVASVTF